MSEKKNVMANVDAIIEDLKKNPSSRFSKSDFQALVYAVLADKEFKAKKWLLKNDQLVEDSADIEGGLRKFMDKLLKHAGMTKDSERAAIIDSFEFGARDVEWVSDAVDEAMYIYTECGKNMRIFRDKMLNLSIRKMTRSGKYDGKVTYKKSVVDRALALEKRRAKKGDA
ncbi:MAG: hypothetical protein NC489_33775 [Ruminococcus flavefaciens]|nr:hypothetical protein [Ruminococcus flavefaciens]